MKEIPALNPGNSDDITSLEHRRKKSLHLFWEIKSHKRELIKMKFALINKTPQIIKG